MIIVSLTTTSNRLALCRQVLVSLVNQHLKPDKVVVWLSEEPYLRDSGVQSADEWVSGIRRHLPNVDIRWTKNIGPYRKLLPSLEAFGTEDIIVTADDDIVYGEYWLSTLIEAHLRHPEAVVASRVRKIKRNKIGTETTYLQWPIVNTEHVFNKDFVITHGGGAVFKKKFIDARYIEDFSFLELAPTADDLWFSKLIEQVDRKVICVPNALKELFFIEHNDGLIKENSPLIKGLFDKFMFWLIYKRLGNLGMSVCGNDIAFKKIKGYFS